jgi:hypothetical protein
MMNEERMKMKMKMNRKKKNGMEDGPVGWWWMDGWLNSFRGSGLRMGGCPLS